MRDPDEKHRAELTLMVLDILTAAISAPTIESSGLLARDMARAVLEGVPAEDCYRVAGALAVAGVWALPPGRPRSADQVRERLAQVRRFVERERMEASWSVS